MRAFETGDQIYQLVELDPPGSVIIWERRCEEAEIEIPLSHSADAAGQKLEQFEIGVSNGEKKLGKSLEESHDLLTTEGGKPILVFKAQVTGLNLKGGCNAHFTFRILSHVVRVPDFAALGGGSHREVGCQVGERSVLGFQPEI
jgi:hypothetical protein